MLREFKEFAMKGSVLDLAVGVIIGAAFGKIVTSLVTDVIMPPVGLLMGGVDFSGLFINLSRTTVASPAAAKAANIPTLNYGLFLNSVIDFLLVALVIFILVKQINRLRKQPEPAPNTRACPYCVSQISKEATRCPQCTSELKAA